MTADLAPEVQRTHELTVFLRAQWDKEAAELDQLMSAPLMQGYLRVHGARLRADIESKRQTLAKHKPGRYGECEVCDVGAQSCGCCGWGDYPCDTVRLLAQPYDGEDGYKEDWRP